MPEEAKREHVEEGVAVNPPPAAPFVVIAPELVLHLLVRLLAAPARLDGPGQRAAPGAGRRIAEVIHPPLAEIAAVLTRNTDRVLALLDEGGVVDDQHRIPATDEPVGRLDQERLQGRRVTGRDADEVVELLTVSRRDLLGQMRHALALGGPKESFDVERRPVALFGALEPVQEGVELPVECLLPVGRSDGFEHANLQVK